MYSHSGLAKIFLLFCIAVSAVTVCTVRRKPLAAAAAVAEVAVKIPPLLDECFPSDEIRKIKFQSSESVLPPRVTSSCPSQGEKG